MRNHAPRKAAKASLRPQSAAVDFFRRKLEFEIGPYSLKETMDSSPDKVRVVDVRGAESYAEGHLPTAINIPLADIASRLSSLPRNRTIVTYCGDITCPLSSRAALELAQKGYKVSHLVGGIVEWSRKGYPVESAPSEPPAPEGGPME